MREGKWRGEGEEGGSEKDGRGKGGMERMGKPEVGLRV